MYHLNLPKTHKKPKHKGDPFLLRGQYDVSAVCCRRSAKGHCRPAVLHLCGRTEVPLSRIFLFLGIVTAVCTLVSALGRMKTTLSCRSRLRRQYEDKLRQAEGKIKKQAQEQLRKLQAESCPPAAVRHAG